jgi:hypothetical protein
VLVLAVAGGAWALFGRGGSDTPAALGASASTTSAHPAGPVVPGIKSTPTPTPAPTASPTAGPVATASTPAVATSSPTPAPSQALVSTPSASPSPKPSASRAPVAKPPVTGPQQGGTVTKRAFTFHVARGDTLWELTTSALRSTGRSTSNANVAAHVAKLYQANRSIIGPDPNLLLVGQTITWPASL